MNIVFGAPGTGKTTYLLNILEQRVKSGLNLDNIAFISFTKKAVNEAKERFITQNKCRYFRTLHSFCFLMLGMKSTQMLVNYNDFSEVVGWPILGKKIESEDNFATAEKGDKLLHLNNLCRLKKKNLVELDIDSDVTLEEYNFFSGTLDNYKKNKMLYDFTDLIEKYYYEGYRPKLDLLIVDEAQDLSALQWDVVTELANKSNETFIAGDDDQAIFSWAGADVNKFIDLSKTNKTIILNHSYRLPKIVHELSCSIVNKLKTRVNKVITCRKEQGSVEYINSIEDIDLSKDKWLLLYRNNFYMTPHIKYIRSNGYFFSILGETNENETLKTCFYYEKIRRNESIPFQHFEQILKLTTQKINKSNLQLFEDKAIDVKALDFLNFNRARPWYEALDKITSDEKEYFLAARRNGEELLKEPRIKLSTIHSAKGGECENVVIYMDVTEKVYNSLLSDSGDETRVLYTAVTRAKNNLFLLQPKTKFYYSID
jgi:superfamily I DNA/RNA helicase